MTGIGIWLCLVSAEIEPLVSTARHMQQQGDETKITSDQPAKAMPRIVSLTSFCVVVLVWTSVFLFLARYFLFSAHESWFQEEEKKLMGEVEFKIDNLDARNLRQLNQLYAQVKKVEELLMTSHPCLRHGNCSTNSHPVPMKDSPRSVSDSPILEPSIAVLVIACDRVNYVKQAIDSLLKYRPSAGLFPIVVSQDCGHEPTAAAIASYGNRITHIKHTDNTEIVIPPKHHVRNRKAEIGYYKIARHYKWALTQVFEKMNNQYAIIVEDDLDISPDFYSYFSSLLFLLDNDRTVWCISAWNDNGKDGYIDKQQNDLLYRTDFFPGLGWMVTRQTWEELKPKWPKAYWDDWMREPEQRKGRVCVRPEISRTKTFGKVGVSSGLYFNQHLQYIVLNSNAVNFRSKNLTYLLEGTYEKEFVLRVLALPVVDVSDVTSRRRPELKEVQVRYSNKKDFERIAKQLKIMSDLRGGVPRTAYKGIVSIMYRGQRVHLTPPSPWRGYESLG